MSELLELGPGRENKGRGRLWSGGVEGPGLRVPVELEEEW
jgi:hypothetical protein